MDILLGYLIKKTGLYDKDFFLEHIRSSAPKSKPELGELNVKALLIGYGYEG